MRRGRPKLYSTLYERLVANTVLADPDNIHSCWLWTGPMGRGGYPKICVRRPGGGRKTSPHTRGAHRVMLEEITGYEFPFDEAGHRCGNTACICPWHLEIQTKAHNLAERRGYAAPGGGKPWIPTLFPRADPVADAIDRIWEESGWGSVAASA